jgi:hypothetical protein
MKRHAGSAVVEIADRRVLPDQLRLRLDAQDRRLRNGQAAFERRADRMTVRRRADALVSRDEPKKCPGTVTGVGANPMSKKMS